jgi:hypothetical protein
MDECYDYQIKCVNCHSVVMTDKSDYCCCNWFSINWNIKKLVSLILILSGRCRIN